MIRHIWSGLCERAVVDQATGQVSLFTMLERLTAKNLPFTIPWMSVASYWANDGDTPNASEYKLVVKAPGGKKLFELGGVLDEAVPGAGHRTILSVNAFRVEKVGTYRFIVSQKVEKNFKTVADIPLFVLVDADKKGEKRPKDAQH